MTIRHTKKWKYCQVLMAGGGVNDAAMEAAEMVPVAAGLLACQVWL
jgi:hypothetical protein